jgi:hypothetical protein
MLALRELQIQFVAALFDSADDRVQSEIVPDGTGPADRLDIYRNNLREGFIKALGIGFPVIERLVGADYFRQLALDFLQAHPSRAGNLHHIGAPLSAFLQQRFADTEHAYLADIAALEWAHQEALIAPDAHAIGPDAWQGIDPALYEQLRFDLHPACGLVKSSFPIVRIWCANQPESANDDLIDLRGGGDNVLVLRTPECIELHRLPAGDFTALDALARNQTLGEALELAQAADSEFDLSAALRRFIQLRILTGLRTPS